MAEKPRQIEPYSLVEVSCRTIGSRYLPEEVRSIETLELGRLPCWKNLSPEAYRERIADLIEQIESEAAADRWALGQKVVGRKAILRKSPHFAPPKQKRSRKPLFFAASKEAYRRRIETFKDFLSAYTEASARLHEGLLDVVFPSNCFPPGLPFTGTGLSRAGPSAETAAALP